MELAVHSRFNPNRKGVPMKKSLVVFLALVVGLSFALAQQEKAPKAEGKKAVQTECTKAGKEGCGAEMEGCSEMGEKTAVKGTKSSKSCCPEGKEAEVKKEGKTQTSTTSKASTTSKTSTTSTTSKTEKK
jgi:hypothetical protein